MIGNPGTGTDELYRISATADTLVLFEGTAAGFRRYRPASWVLTYSPRGFAAIVHGAPGAEDLRRVVAHGLSGARGGALRHRRPGEQSLRPPSPLLG